jgi:hypothetical protein
VFGRNILNTLFWNPLIYNLFPVHTITPRQVWHDSLHCHLPSSLYLRQCLWYRCIYEYNHNEERCSTL